MNDEIIKTNHTGNISAGGAFVDTDQNFNVGDNVEMQLFIPADEKKDAMSDNASIKATGKVVRAQNGGVAVAFGEVYKILPHDDEDDIVSE